jgi:hypothetical protein
MSTRSPQTPVAEPIPHEVLSMDEIFDRYAGEWIILHVTQYDEGWPTHGIVKVHAPTQMEMLDEMERSPDPPELARLPQASFLADRRYYIDDPEEIRKFIDEWIKSDDDVD